MSLSEQEIVRREKLDALRKMNINPYPADLYPVDITTKEIKENFEEGKKVIIAGRLMSRRIQGKPSFAELQDSEGRIQVYFKIGRAPCRETQQIFGVAHTSVHRERGTRIH